MDFIYEFEDKIKICILANDVQVYQHIENYLGGSGFRDEHIRAFGVSFGVHRLTTPSGLDLKLMMFYLRPHFKVQSLVNRYLSGSLALVLVGVSADKLQSLLYAPYHVPQIITNNSAIKVESYPDRLVTVLDTDGTEYFADFVDEILKTIAMVSKIEFNEESPISFSHGIDHF